MRKDFTEGWSEPADDTLLLAECFMAASPPSKELRFADTGPSLALS
jgi:hypothetical protein